MGNAITANVNLDHEIYYQQEAIEAGKSLTGKVIIQVQETLEPTNLTLEVNGKEKTVAYNALNGHTKLRDKHSFFRADVQLHEAEEQIEPNTYVFPFSVSLPKSLPSSRSYEQDDASFHIEYNLKLKTKTCGTFPNKRSFLVSSSHYLLSEPVPLLLQPKPITAEVFGIPGIGPIFMGAHVRNTNVARGSQLEVSLACRNESTCKIERAQVTLEEEYYWTTKSTGGHEQKTLIEHKNVETDIPGIRLMELYPNMVNDTRSDEEVVARRMFKDLKSRRSILALTIPKTTKESYTGLVLKISHYLKFTLITKTKGDSSSYPSVLVPIQIRSEPSAMIRGNMIGGSDHVSERARIRFPLATTAPEAVVLGRNAGMLDNEDSFTHPIPAPTDDEPTFSVLLEEIAASIDDYDFISEKMKDLEWAIFFASLSPTEFGTVVAHVNSEFAQPRVAALLAKNYGGDFTCAHCGAAIQNSSIVFRSNMVEGLLAYCVDLGENNHLIRSQLSDFEQIIVALHALHDEEEEPEPSVRRRSSATRQVSPPGANDAVSPKSDDVCVGLNEHPGTMELLQVIKRSVYQDTSQVFCPPVYRKIKSRFKDRRFLVRPVRGSANYWRQASNREQIEYVGNAYDSLQQSAAKQKHSEQSDKWNEPTEQNEANWHEAFHGSASEWDVAVTIHTYASALDEGEDFAEESEHGPMAVDICFDKPKHPGTAAVVKAIRRSLQEFAGVEWSPPIYRNIKSLLKGRRYFVKVGKSEWREATQLERRETIERYYQEEKRKAQKQEKPRRSRVSTTKYQSTNGNGRRASTGADPGNGRRASPGPINGRRAPSTAADQRNGRRASRSPGPMSGRRASTGADPANGRRASPGPMNGRRASTGPVNGRRASAGTEKMQDPSATESQSTGEMGLNDENGDRRQTLRRRFSRKNSARNIAKRGMRHPRDMDICYGSKGHPGTVDLEKAILHALREFHGKEWCPPIFKSIRAQLQGKRFFIRKDEDSAWAEATSEERVEQTRQVFEAKRRDNRI